MFGTSNVIEVTKEQILSTVDDFTLFKHYIEGFKQVGSKFRSELRKDNNPSCGIFSTGKTLLYKDFSTGESYDIFTYVSLKYGLTFKESLHKIAVDFKLTDEAFVGTAQRIQHSLPEEPVKTIIKVKSRPFTTVDIDYWEQYGITLPILHFFNVKPISTHWLIKDDKVLMSKHNGLAYRYYFNNGIYKLYFPDDSVNKWYSTRGEYVQGYLQLPSYGKQLIITSSYKDVMTLYRFGITAIAPPSETQALSPYLVAELKRRFTEILIYYDNDETGIMAANNHSSRYNLKYIHNPIGLPKDPSDLVKVLGLKETYKAIENVLGVQHEPKTKTINS